MQQMQALQDAVTKHCGGPNGLVSDPPSCRFDPGELQCPQQEGSVCLSPEQVVAVRKVYEGPRTSSGTQILPGYSRGGERGWEQFYAQVRADGTEGGGSWLGVYRYMVFDDPAWNLQQMNFDKDPALAKRKLGPVLDADSPDLDAFAERGGKLIVYQGWADQQVPAESSLQYHAAVVARSGREKTDRFYRLFMVPGMAHCFPESVAATASAPRGPNLVPHPEYDPSIPPTLENDALSALQQWVENGRAPQQFVVRIRNESAGLAERTVRACAEPYRAAYRGRGDPLEASTWECVATQGGSTALRLQVHACIDAISLSTVNALAVKFNRSNDRRQLARSIGNRADPPHPDMCSMQSATIIAWASNRGTRVYAGTCSRRRINPIDRLMPFPV